MTESDVDFFAHTTFFRSSSMINGRLVVGLGKDGVIKFFDDLNDALDFIGVK